MNRDITSEVAKHEEWLRRITSTLDAILESSGAAVKSTAVSGTQIHTHAGGGQGGPLNKAVHSDYDEMIAVAAPGVPVAGKARFYAKLSSGIAKLFYKQSDGTEIGPLAAAGAAAAHDHTTGDGSGVLTNDEHDGHSEYAEIATPATPGAGKARIYPKADGNFYQLDDAGLETSLAGGGGSALTVREEDGAPLDAAVTIIRVPNGGLIDNGVGDVSLGYELAGAVATHAAAGDPHSAYAFDSDLATHAGAADPHTGYRLESADHSHQSTGLQGGQLDHGLALTSLTDDDHTQYALLAGRTGAGGQVLKGGTAAADTLKLQGSNNTAGGYIEVKETSIEFGSAITVHKFLTLSQIDFVNALGRIAVRFSDTGGAGGPAVDFAAGVLKVNEDIDISGHLAIGNSAAVSATTLINIGESSTSAVTGIAISNTLTSSAGLNAAWIGFDVNLINQKSGGIGIAQWGGFLFRFSHESSRPVTLAYLFQGAPLIAAAGTGLITDLYSFYGQAVILTAGGTLPTRHHVFHADDNISMTVTNSYRPIYVAGTPSAVCSSVHAHSIQMFSTTFALGGGVGVMGIANRTTAPASTPSGGGVLYAASGAGTWKGSSATVTTFAAAGPHCGRCGMDFWRICAENEVWGASLRECGWCGQVYRKGPKSVLHLLTREQRAELLEVA